MVDLEESINNIKKDSEDIFDTDDLFIEAIQDLIKDEIKQHILNRLEKNKTLKANFKEAVEILIEAKVKEGYAYALIASSSADKGMKLIPPKLREQIKNKVTEIIEKQMEEMIEE